MNLWLMHKEEPTETNRAVLFRTVMQMMLAPLGKGDISWPLEIGEKVFCKIAHEMNESNIITGQQLRTAIRDVFASMDKKSRRLERECFKALGEKSGLLIKRSKDGMVYPSPVFKQFFWSSYCANLSDHDIEMIQKWPTSKLATILEFYFGLADPSNVFDKLITATPNLFYDNLFIAARSIREISGNKDSKRKLLIQLARLMANPQVPFVLREKAVAALVGTRDKGVGYLFCKAVESTDEAMRLLGVAGLGTLVATFPDQTGSKPLQVLIKGAQEESEPIRYAFIHALASTRAPTGLDGIVRILYEGKTESRRIAAEALGQIGNKGRKILLEALNEKNAQVRRAALFGIACFPDPWAIEILKNIVKIDNDWHVSSTAEDLIAVRESMDLSILLSQPLPENMGWLVSWAAKQGEGVPVGDKAYSVLQSACQNAKEPEIKAAAIRTLGDLCRESFLPVVENALNDSIVREAAFYSYVKLNRAWNKGIETLFN
jgi:hypothetical protein